MILCFNIIPIGNSEQPQKTKLSSSLSKIKLLQRIQITNKILVKIFNNNLDILLKISEVKTLTLIIIASETHANSICN